MSRNWFITISQSDVVNHRTGNAGEIVSLPLVMHWMWTLVMARRRWWWRQWCKETLRTTINGRRTELSGGASREQNCSLWCVLLLLTGKIFGSNWIILIGIVSLAHRQPKRPSDTGMRTSHSTAAANAPSFLCSLEPQTTTRMDDEVQVMFLHRRRRRRIRGRRRTVKKWQFAQFMLNNYRKCASM